MVIFHLHVGVCYDVRLRSLFNCFVWQIPWPIYNWLMVTTLQQRLVGIFCLFIFYGEKRKFRIFRLPFQVDRVKRYLLVNFVQTAACWNGTVSCIAVVSIFFGVVYYIEAFFVDIKYMFDEMDKMIENDPQNMKDQTRSTIILHINILDTYHQLRLIMNWVVLWTFGPVTLSMVGSAMQLNSGVTIFGAILSSISVGYLMLVLLAYSYFGKRLQSSLWVSCIYLSYSIIKFSGNHMTDSFLHFTDMIYEAHWYQYPVELQKLLLTVMNTGYWNNY